MPIPRTPRLRGVVRRMPLRLRVTAAFTASMAAVLAALAVFLQIRLGAELSRGIDLELRSRAGYLAGALARPGAPPLNAGGRVVDPDESFAQVLDAGGRVLDASRAARGAALLAPEQLPGTTPVFRTARVPGMDDPVRLLAVPVSVRGARAVVVVGADLGERHEALDRLALLLALGLPAALVLASGAGWLVAGAALRPVERIRREAAALSSEPAGAAPAAAGAGQLTVPETGDELARLAETLNALLRSRQQALERESRFVDEASHELRTPLAILRAELELALTRPRSAAELTAALHAAASETDRLVRLANDLLVLARARPGGLPLCREEVDLHALLADAVAFRSGPGSPVAISVDVAGDLGAATVRADPTRLRQGVDNLVDNALRYGGGTPVTLTAARRAGDVVISVADRGPGFPADALAGAGAVDPARAASAPPAERGLRLGLVIVRAVAEAHGGRVAAGNRPGGGARVDLVLPAEPR